MSKVNGDDVELHYGDQVVPLNDRLARQDRDILWLKRGLAAVMVVLLVHAVAPQLDLFDTLLRLIGI